MRIKYHLKKTNVAQGQFYKHENLDNLCVNFDFDGFKYQKNIQDLKKKS